MPFATLQNHQASVVCLFLCPRMSRMSSEDELTTSAALAPLSSESDTWRTFHFGGVPLSKRCGLRDCQPFRTLMPPAIVFSECPSSSGVVKVARCRPSALVIVAVVWGGPIAVKTRSCGALALPEACLEICLEAWSLGFFACGVCWVKFPCFVILDFGSVLSVGSYGWRQSVDTKVGRSLIRWLSPLPLETKVKGLILTPCNTGGPFLHLEEPEAASLP
ncbi:hypothetical protein Tco_0222112 [Tanacetum coccineum]